jgi:glycosyltransferase involved in cell wall biosynthesis
LVRFSIASCRALGVTPDKADNIEATRVARWESTVSASGVVLQFSSMVPPTLYGGAELIIGTFGEELQAAGFRVYNRGLKPRGNTDGPGQPIRNIYWPFDERRHGVAQRTLWHAVDTLMLPARSAVEDLVNELRPDVMITHNLGGWGFAPWVVAGQKDIPLVHVVHDYALLCNSRTLWRGGRVCTGVCKPCRPRAHATQRRWPGGQIVVYSRGVLAEHRRRGLPDFDNAVVVDPTAAAQIPQSRRQHRPDTVPPSTLGYLGRLSDAKGVAILLAAIEGSDKRLIAAGEGERNYVGELKGRASEQVQWRGWTEPGVLFDSIDVLVVPSIWLEPFGLVVVEAARAGLPVLIADRPGLIEAAHASGARYSTFLANDVESLREALGRPLSCYRAEPAATAETDIVQVVTRLVSTRRTSGSG